MVPGYREVHSYKQADCMRNIPESGPGCVGGGQLQPACLLLKSQSLLSLPPSDLLSLHSLPPSAHFSFLLGGRGVAAAGVCVCVFLLDPCLI